MLLLACNIVKLVKWFFGYRVIRIGHLLSFAVRSVETAYRELDLPFWSGLLVFYCGHLEGGCCLSFCLRVSVPVHPMNLCVVFVPWSFSYNLNNYIRQHTGMFSLAPTHCDKIWRAKNMLAAKCQTQVYNEVNLKISSSHQCELCTHKDSLRTVIMAQLVNAYWQTVPRAHKGLALISPRDVLRV